jgi:phage minor structural protein
VLEVYDPNRVKTAILQNAFDMREELKMNAVSYFYFSLPGQDPKNEFCKPFHYVRYNEGQLYRIMPLTATIDGQDVTEYQCEHVIALLLDRVLFGQYTLGGPGVYTRDVITDILGRQLTQNWVLKDCDFAYAFEYGFEQENLLGALFSIPKNFPDLYMWTFDTSLYPYRISLKKIDLSAAPRIYVFLKKNMLKVTKTSDPQTFARGCIRLGRAKASIRSA